MKSDFMVKIANIIAEVLVRTSIDKLDVKVIEDILQEELIKYHNEVFTYGHSIGYDDGYIAGDEYGHSEGYSNGHSDGYALGYSEGYENGHYEGYDAGHSDGYYEGHEHGYEDGYSESHS